MNHQNKLKTKYKNTTVAEFLVQKQICEMGQIFIGSQGSTVSVHSQYINHLKNKPHEYYSFVKSTAFNSNTLTMNLVNPDKGSLGFDLVPNKSKKRKIKNVLSNSFGFGGTNASLVIGSLE